MRKQTRAELDRLRQDVNDLTVTVQAIAAAAGLVALRTPEQKASVKWLRQDSEEWKAEVERRKKQLELLRARAQSQPTYIGTVGI